MTQSTDQAVAALRQDARQWRELAGEARDPVMGSILQTLARRAERAADEMEMALAAPPPSEG